MPTAQVPDTTHHVVRGTPSRWLTVTDLVAVGAFVVIGLSVHRHGLTAASVVSTVWPFTVALGLGWLAALLLRLDIVSPSAGALAAAVTVGAGMVLRVLAGQGTALPFVVVALAFLGCSFLTWRVLALSVRARPSVRSRT